MSKHEPCNCHCHSPVFCTEPGCNQPTGPLEDAAFQERLREAYAEIWNRLTQKIPELQERR